MVRAFSFDHADHHRKFESTRPGAGGIEKEHAVDFFIARLMTMPEHDDIDVFLEQRRSIDVRQKNSLIADRHTNDVVAIGIIVVAADEGDRRNLAERLDDVIAANVAGVENRIDTLERGERLGPDQAVRIGDDADAGTNPRLTLSSPRPSLCIDP